jgi:RimJ/RimL family protein N-acetyltransferase
METITLRPWQLDDKPALLRYADNRNVWINLTDVFPHPYTPEDADRWLWRCGAQQGPHTNMAIDLDGEAIGGAGIELRQGVERKTAYIGYWLGEPFWGRGFATVALRLMTSYAFANFDLIRLQAFVFDWNPASARVLEKCGYKFEARLRQNIFKDDRHCDELIYAMLRSER